MNRTVLSMSYVFVLSQFIVLPVSAQQNERGYKPGYNIPEVQTLPSYETQVLPWPGSIPTTNIKGKIEPVKLYSSDEFSFARQVESKEIPDSTLDSKPVNFEYIKTIESHERTGIHGFERTFGVSMRLTQGIPGDEVTTTKLTPVKYSRIEVRPLYSAGKKYLLEVIKNDQSTSSKLVRQKLDAWQWSPIDPKVWIDVTDVESFKAPLAYAYFFRLSDRAPYLDNNG